MPVRRVLLAQPRGFCAGVEMAIKALAWMVRVFEPPVYCYHEVVAAARSRGRFVVNAVCPLVTKVHHEAKVRAAKGYTILYVGHAGHDEAVGALAVAPGAMRLVEHEEDLDAAVGGVADPRRVALLAQTTLAMNDWRGILD